MVEQSIYFALGCITTALAALMFAPLFWRRALRLTRKRLQLQVPLSMQEILAERDQLRAEFAVERVRIEQKLDKLQASKAADMATIGRRTLEGVELRDDLTALRQVEQGQIDQIAELTRAVAEAGTETSALKTAIEDALARVETWRQRAYASAAEEDRLNNELERHRTTIAGLETRSMGLEMRLTDSERAGAARLNATEDALRGRLEVAMSHATRHESSALSLRRECDDAKARIRTLEDELAAFRDRDATTQLQAGLAARRGERQATSTNEPLEGPHDDLRSSIHALGLAVAIMSKRGGGADMPSTALTSRPARADAPSAANVD